MPDPPTVAMGRAESQCVTRFTARQRRTLSTPLQAEQANVLIGFSFAMEEHSDDPFEQAVHVVEEPSSV